MIRSRVEPITIYQNPACTTCRQVYAALKERGVDFNEVNYYVSPLSKMKLKELIASAPHLTLPSPPLRGERE